jgi:hypothetical protein
LVLNSVTFLKRFSNLFGGDDGEEDREDLRQRENALAEEEEMEDTDMIYGVSSEEDLTPEGERAGDGLGEEGERDDDDEEINDNDY